MAVNSLLWTIPPTALLTIGKGKRVFPTDLGKQPRSWLPVTTTWGCSKTISVASVLSLLRVTQVREIWKRESMTQQNWSTKQDSRTTLPRSSHGESKKTEKGKSPAAEYGANYGHGAFSSLCSAKVAKQSPQYSEHTFCSGQSTSEIPALLVTKGGFRNVIMDAMTVSSIARDVIFQSLIQKPIPRSDTRTKTSGFGVLAVHLVLATTSQQDDQNLCSAPRKSSCCVAVLCVQAVQVVEVAHTVHY